MADNFYFVDQNDPLSATFLGPGKEGAQINWDNLSVTRRGNTLDIILTDGKHRQVVVYEQLPTDRDIKFMKQVLAGDAPYPFDLPPADTEKYAVLFNFPPFPRQAVVFAHVTRHSTS